MSQAAKHNIVMYERGGWELNFWLLDKDDNPLDDYTGYYAQMMIREETDGDVVKELDSNTAGGVTIDGPNAKFTVSIPFDETDDLLIRQGVYDIFIQDDEANPTLRSPILYGAVTVLPAVTR